LNREERKKDRQGRKQGIPERMESHKEKGRIRKK
jgi:hypothetical protein